jgi:hypothetical protein
MRKRKYLDSGQCRDVAMQLFSEPFLRSIGQEALTVVATNREAEREQEGTTQFHV